MKPEAAVVRICAAIAGMNRLYERPVFDEWALIDTTGPRGRVLGYDGPRRAEFVRTLAGDLGPLREELDGRLGDPGAFGFAREAAGGRLDAFISAGPSLLVVFNNTEATVGEISSDPLWRKAQVPFAELAEAFRLDPVGAAPIASVAAQG